MNRTPILRAVAIACALSFANGALAAPASDTFINPDWANSAWYIGTAIGQTRAAVDDTRIARSLAANGATVTSISTGERDLGFSLFAGKQLNQYMAIEAGYFDLGKFDVTASTSDNGRFHGEAGFRGGNLDLVGQLPLNQRWSVLGRAGLHYTRTNTHFEGNRLAAVTNPNASESKVNGKFGLGLEYKFSEALAARGEVTRLRVDDAVGNRGDIDFLSVSLVYKLGRPSQPAYVAPPPAMPAPVSVAPAVAVAPPPPPVVSEKVSFAAESLFDFDRAEVKPEGKAALDALLAKLAGMDTEVMVAVGHTDAVGTAAYNEALSLRRADAVKAYLVSAGLAPDRLYTEGKGESQPVADNGTAEGRARNRRVTIEVVGTRKVVR